MSDSDYYDRYVKYKTKYSQLKNNYSQIDGMSSSNKSTKPLIIHIAGTPGSGKTTLGKKLNQIYNNQIFVYDTDDFFNYTEEEKNQLFNEMITKEQYLEIWTKIISKKLNKLIHDNANEKIIVLTGILTAFGQKWCPLFDVGADYRFMIKISLEEVIKRYYTRVCKNEEWKEIVNLNIYVASSYQMIDRYEDDSKKLKELDYQEYTDLEILDRVDSIIRKYH